MSSLIPITNVRIGNETVQTVNAKELHAFLKVKKDFPDWIRARIKRSRLVEDRDFVVFAEKNENSGRGRPSMEYHLTIDTAKHVAMMIGTDKGFEARDYFIECERQTRQQIQLRPVEPSLLSRVVIEDVSIRQDSQGLYCLNDLHKAYGAGKKRRPFGWIKTSQAHELIAKLKQSTDPELVINIGPNYITYACKALVFSYATWLCPTFGQEVLRAFNLHQSGGAL